MKNVFFLFLVFVVFSFGMEACYYDVASELYPNTMCDTTAFNYTNVISPIISDNCVSCHDAGTMSGNIDISTYALLQAETEGGNVICSIKQDGSCSAMPKDAGKMSDCNIKLIELVGGQWLPGKLTT